MTSCCGRPRSAYGGGGGGGGGGRIKSVCSSFLKMSHFPTVFWRRLNSETFDPCPPFSCCVPASASVTGSCTPLLLLVAAITLLLLVAAITLLLLVTAITLR